jgi:hypothetical protein
VITRHCSCESNDSGLQPPQARAQSGIGRNPHAGSGRLQARVRPALPRHRKVRLFAFRGNRIDRYFKRYAEIRSGADQFQRNVI